MRTSSNVPRFGGEKHLSFGTLSFALKARFYRHCIEFTYTHDYSIYQVLEKKKKIYMTSTKRLEYYLSNNLKRKMLCHYVSLKSSNLSKININ